jgi:hypothetical protein
MADSTGLSPSLDVAGRPHLHQVLIGYNIIAASAAGVVPFLDQQRSLAVGSCPGLGRQCNSCFEQTCLRVTVYPTPFHHFGGLPWHCQAAAAWQD